MVKGVRSKFVRIICTRCGSGQIIFGKPSTRVKCLKCNRLLVKVSGGKAKIKTLVREVLK